MGLLKNKYAVVTGAASARGLGKATASLFAPRCDNRYSRPRRRAAKAAGPILANLSVSPAT